MVSTASLQAGSMKPQVLTSRRSAAAGSPVTSQPAWVRPSQHDLRVHQVLGAAQGDGVDTVFGFRFSVFGNQNF